MILARVRGRITSTIHHDSMEGRTLLVLDKLDPTGTPTGGYVIAVDSVGVTKPYPADARRNTPITSFCRFFVSAFNTRCFGPQATSPFLTRDFRVLFRSRSRSRTSSFFAIARGLRGR